MADSLAHIQSRLGHIFRSGVAATQVIQIGRLLRQVKEHYPEHFEATLKSIGLDGQLAGWHIYKARRS
jgi:hypothetical protein